MDTLTHAERVRQLVALGRRAAAADAEAVKQLFALSSGDAYDRSLAISATWGSRDADSVLAGLADPSRTVRCKAARALRLVESNERVVEGLGRVRDPRLLTKLLGLLSCHRRQACVDAFLENRALIDLMPLGSRELVVRHFAALTEKASPVGWDRLAERHAELVADELLRRLDEQAQTLDPRLVWRLLRLLPRLARRAPQRSVELVKRLLLRGHSPHGVALALRELLRRCPTETFDMLRALQEGAAPVHPPGPFAVVQLDQVAHKLGSERLAWLVRHAWSVLSDQERGRRWLLRLSPAERAAFLEVWLMEGRGAWGAFLLRHVDTARPERESAYRRWSAAAQDERGVIKPRVLDALPSDLRIREARRHLEMKIWTTKPQEKMEYASLLGFADAKSELAPWLGHPEGAERALAARQLMGTVAHDRKALPEALAYAHARKFEQDPVRFALVDGLAKLKVACFQPADLRALGEVIEDALDAADLSQATATAAEQLVVRLFRVDARWGAGWLTRILATRGSISATGLGEHLNPREVRELAPILAELAQSWSTHERAYALLWLAGSLGRRLPLVEALGHALEKMARELPFVHVAGQAIALLHRHWRARFRSLVLTLLAEDPSFIILSQVRDFVSCRRQDLLDPFLEDRPMEGRFASGRTEWVLAFSRGIGTWNARQQRAHAERLRRALAEENQDVIQMCQAIEALARLAFAPPDALLQHAADKRQAVREMVVRALPWLDGGEGLPVLVEALGDDRARWAIYALRKCFRELDEGRILELLGRAPMSKVTVAKEVVRLLGELRSDDAYRQLLALEGTGLHRDVRVALLRALWDHLEHETTWQVLERAVADPDWIIAAKLTEVPLGRLSPTSEERVARLLARVLERPEPEARLDLLPRIAYLPLADRARVLFRRCLLLVESRDQEECTRALTAVLVRMAPGDSGEVLTRLAPLVKQRKILTALANTLAAQAGPYASAWVREVARGFCVTVGADPMAVALFLDLASRVYDWKQLAAALVDVSQRNLLHADAMTVALRAMARSTHPELIEQQLANQGDANLRRLALEGLTQAAGPGRGWSHARRERLEKYRSDPSPLVAGAAAFVFPPD